jgi:hypothetical protein
VEDNADYQCPAGIGILDRATKPMRRRGLVDEHRLYQLIRENGGISDYTFEIEFFDPGVQAYAFTFG